jgi:serine/threonine protein kinase
MNYDEEAIFYAAREKQSPEEREQYLQLACGGDNRLRHRLLALLDADCNPHSYLNSPAVVPTVQISECTERPGDSIGPFKLIEQIGEGGMGVVYMAEQKRPVRRTVALKIIKPGMDTKE